eukprot:scaffold88040_cov19-Tisochrysis_lutea.AAC.2
MELLVLTCRAEAAVGRRAGVAIEAGWGAGVDGGGVPVPQHSLVALAALPASTTLTALAALPARDNYDSTHATHVCSGGRTRWVGFSSKDSSSAFD